MNFLNAFKIPLLNKTKVKSLSLKSLKCLNKFRVKNAFFPKAQRKIFDDPDLKNLWLGLRAAWFTERVDLDQFTVRWSRRRQKRTLASCNIRLKRVMVAGELKNPALRCWLEPLLYHEMCHAVLDCNIERIGRRRAWHGGRFHELEGRHPQIKALNRWIKSGGWNRVVHENRIEAGLLSARPAESSGRQSE